MFGISGSRFALARYWHGDYHTVAGFHAEARWTGSTAWRGERPGSRGLKISLDGMRARHEPARHLRARYPFVHRGRQRATVDAPGVSTSPLLSGDEYRAPSPGFSGSAAAAPEASRAVRNLFDGSLVCRRPSKLSIDIHDRASENTTTRIVSVLCDYRYARRRWTRRRSWRRLKRGRANSEPRRPRASFACGAAEKRKWRVEELERDVDNSWRHAPKLAKIKRHQMRQPFSVTGYFPRAQCASVAEAKFWKTGCRLPSGRTRTLSGTTRVLHRAEGRDASSGASADGSARTGATATSVYVVADQRDGFNVTYRPYDDGLSREGERWLSRPVCATLNAVTRPSLGGLEDDMPLVQCLPLRHLKD